MAITLTDNQQRVFDRIKDFIMSPDDTVFILRGYAGTGKTTLAGFITEWLSQNKMSYTVMAPTGRAAKVIESKVGSGQTIHSTIYTNMPVPLGAGGPINDRNYFIEEKIRVNPNMTKCLIVDESSMISDDRERPDSLFRHQGTLLEDIFSYMRANYIPKIIFMGDDAQLPPISSDYSSALDREWIMRKYGLGVREERLTEVLRQNGDSAILREASEMRMSLAVRDINMREHTIDYNGKDVRRVQASDIARTFYTLFPNPELGSSVVISWTNPQTLKRNHEIRALRWKNRHLPPILPDDLLLICNNTTFSGKKFYNGQFAKVIAVYGRRVKTVEVRVRDRGRRTSHLENITLIWREADIDTGTGPVRVIMLENFIECERGEVPPELRKAIYIDFVERMAARGIDEYDDAFREELGEDRFFNALLVKYGYAITCHKSQGGEWDTVFVDYRKRSGTASPEIRWAYTATTRAKQTLYIANEPKNLPHR